MFRLCSLSLLCWSLLCTGFVAVAPLAQAAAASGALVGRVANESTRAYLEGATVQLKGTALATLTDENGAFSFAALAPGAYLLIVSYTGLDTAEEQVVVAPGATVRREIALSSGIYLLAPVAVVGEREGNAKAITLQRHADNVRNVVDAEAFGSVADGNIGDFLKLIPGVNAEGKNNETWSLRVRGMDPGLNSVLVDGFKTAGANLDSSLDASRATDVGIVPIEGIATLEVTKSPTPSQPADSIGGAINLITKSAFDRKYEGPRASVSGGAIGRSYRNHLAWNGKFTFQDVYGVGGNEKNLALSVTGSSSDNYIPNNRIQQTWNTNSATDSLLPTLSEMRVFEARIYRRRAGGTVSADYKFSPQTTFKVRSMLDLFNQKSYENYIGFKPAEIATQNWIYWKDRKSRNIALIAEHKFANGKLDAGAQIGESAGRFYETNDRHQGGQLLFKLNPTAKPTFALDTPYATGFKYTTVRQLSGPDYANPANWRLNNEGYRIRNIENFNDSLNAYLNGEKSFTLCGSVPFREKAGLNFAEKKTWKIHDEKKYTYYGADGIYNTADDLGLGAWVRPDEVPYPLYSGKVLYNGAAYAPPFPSATLASASLAQQPALWTNAANRTTYNPTTWYNNFLANDKTTTESTTAAYSESSLKLGRLNVLAGVRYERTDILMRYHEKVNNDYRAARTRRQAHYDDFFPSAHLKYTVLPNLQARASYAETIGRPSFGTLIADEIVNYSTHDITRANTDLQPQSARNYDLTLEYYFEPVGLLSVNAFKKDIRNFILNDSLDLAPGQDPWGYGAEFYDTAVPWTVAFKRNAGSASVRGLELAYQQQFTFLPGLLKGLGGYVNYTHLTTHSDKGGSTESGSLTNYVPRIFNAGLSWRYQRFDVRVRYNWLDDYLRQDSANARSREYVRQTARYDLNCNFRVTRHFSVYCDVFNLFNGHEVFYRGNYQMVRDEDNGVRYSFGGTWRL